jgi:hypothetical protein
MRASTSMGRLLDNPHITENSVNSDAFATRKLRRPKTPVSQAASGIITISDIR